MTIAAIDQCKSLRKKGEAAGALSLIAHLADVDLAGPLGLFGAAGEGACIDGRRALSSGSSDGAMPSGSTVGSKLMSRAFPASSVCTALIVMVPASIERRESGQGLVASLVGSPGAPMVRINRQLNGPRVTASDQVVEQVVLLCRRAGAGGLHVLERDRGPAHRNGRTCVVGEMKRVEPVEGAVGEARTGRGLLDDLHRCGGLGMAGQKRGHLLRVGLAGRGQPACERAVARRNPAGCCRGKPGC